MRDSGEVRGRDGLCVERVVGRGDESRGWEGGESTFRLSVTLEQAPSYAATKRYTVKSYMSDIHRYRCIYYLIILS